MGDEQERYMSVAELSDMLGVPKSWVYSRTAADEIPHVKLGHYVRFRMSEIAEWLNGMKQPRCAC